MSTTLVSAGTDVPVDLTREEAQRAAMQELADPRYHVDDPSLLSRGVQWVLEHLAELLARAGNVSPGGYQGLVALGCLAVLAVIAIRLAVGRVGRVTSSAATPFEQRPRSAAQYRQAAEDYAARAAWAPAVRERLRAIVRDLEQRDLLEARPGRTADEAAVQAGAALPDCAAGLREAARIFDEVWYGARPATAQMYARLRDVDDATRQARPAAPVPAG
ncbi:MAG: DUF4129 domain-containing protein [Pseudonocardiaceae bacterium]